MSGTCTGVSCGMHKWEASIQGSCNPPAPTPSSWACCRKPSPLVPSLRKGCVRKEAQTLLPRAATAARAVAASTSGKGAGGRPFSAQRHRTPQLHCKHVASGRVEACNAAAGGQTQSLFGAGNLVATTRSPHPPRDPLGMKRSNSPERVVCRPRRRQEGRKEGRRDVVDHPHSSVSIDVVHSRNLLPLFQEADARTILFASRRCQ